MRRRSLAIFAAALLFTQASCFGSFGLTRSVWKFNRDIGTKWVQEVLFLAMVIVPVYGIAAFVDAIVFNTVEFWSGSNPVAGLPGDENNTRIVELPDGTPLKMVRESEDVMRIEHDGTVRHLVRTDAGFVIRDTEGETLAAATPQANGDVVVTAEGLERRYGAEELALAGSSSVANAAWAVEQARLQHAALSAR